MAGECWAGNRASDPELCALRSAGEARNESRKLSGSDALKTGSDWFLTRVLLAKRRAVSWMLSDCLTCVSLTKVSSAPEGCSVSLARVSGAAVLGEPVLVLEPGVRGRGRGRARDTVPAVGAGWCGLGSCELHALLPVVWGDGCRSSASDMTGKAESGRGGKGGVVQLLLRVPPGEDALLVTDADVPGLGGRAGGAASTGRGGIAGATSATSTVVCRANLDRNEPRSKGNVCDDMSMVAERANVGRGGGTGAGKSSTEASRGSGGGDASGEGKVKESSKAPFLRGVLKARSLGLLRAIGGLSAGFGFRCDVSNGPDCLAPSTMLDVSNGSWVLLSTVELTHGALSVSLTFIGPAPNGSTAGLGSGNVACCCVGGGGVLVPI